MKKIALTIFSLFLLSSVYSIDIYTELKIKFVKGNIQDKISTIKEADKVNSAKLSSFAIDFVLDNMNLLNNDRDLAGLAIAAVLAFPESDYLASSMEWISKFESIYYNFSDENVKIAILDKIAALSNVKVEEKSITFINNYLNEANKDKVKSSEVEKKAIQIISKIGNQSSFEILYNIYQNSNWSDINNDVKNALILLAAKSADKIDSLIQNADFSKLQQIYSIFLENPQNTVNLNPEIAEKLLTASMIIIRDSSKISKEISDFQLNNAKILYDFKWTRSSELMVSYFEVAKTEYAANFLTDSDFSNVIKYVERLASKNSVNIFVAYLEDLHRQMSLGTLSSETVVSALIQALGSLGDKSAFDCLLYTTYLGYSENIIAQARSALSSLKW